jgi:hypothetical protein
MTVFLAVGWLVLGIMGAGCARSIMEGDADEPQDVRPGLRPRERAGLIAVALGGPLFFVVLALVMLGCGIGWFVWHTLRVVIDIFR